MRSLPRSSPTTLSPALVSSRAMMAPVQPMPTMTASTSFSFVAIARAPLREICDRTRRRDVALVVVGVDLLAVERRQAREAEHLPPDLVAVAAVHRIGEEALHHDRDHAVEEAGCGEILEFRLTLLDLRQGIDALGRFETIEVLAERLARPRIGGRDAGDEIFVRRQRELVALLGLAPPERAGAVHPVAGPVGAGEL